MAKSPGELLWDAIAEHVPTIRLNEYKHQQTNGLIEKFDDIDDKKLRQSLQNTALQVIQRHRRQPL